MTEEYSSNKMSTIRHLVAEKSRAIACFVFSWRYCASSAMKLDENIFRYIIDELNYSLSSFFFDRISDLKSVLV